MEQVRGEYIIHNENLHPVTEFGKFFRPDVRPVYEVIRIQEGRPLFLSEHLNRMKSSVQKTGETISVSVTNRILSGINNLTKTNGFTEGNIKIFISFQSAQPDLIMFFMPHHYPSGEDYLTGVRVGLYKATRSMPTAKIANTSLRENVNQFLAHNQLFEALLVDDSGYITEGSRSNVFFLMEDNSFVTAPEDCILPGITRKYVIRIIEESTFKLQHRKLKTEELKYIQGAFLTGTSPKVMPICSIDKFQLSVGQFAVKDIMDIYDQLIRSDTAQSYI